MSRGDNGDTHDNNAIVVEILALRAERAKRLGYETHAHWALENTMAKTPERALALMEAVWTPAVARVREEVADMQAVADAEDAGIKIAAWDYRYYAEKVRKARYDLDENAVRPYLQLDELREGMFWVAGRLFGLRFSPVPGVPVYHPDVVVYEVEDAAGKHVGLWYFDPWARAGEALGRVDDRLSRPGALRRRGPDDRLEQRQLREGRARRARARRLGRRADPLPRVRPRAARPVLERDLPLGLRHRGRPRLRRVPLAAPRELALDARRCCRASRVHDQTGQPLPPELVAQIERASTFNQGFDTVEYLASALVDMKLHLAGGAPIDPAAFERDTLAALGMPSEIVMRHRTPQFTHVFADDGYSAGYYSYLWADTLSADAWEAFTEAGGPYDEAVAKRLRDEVFSAGNTVDPADAYRAFRGRDAGTSALMRKRGFPAPAKPTGD